MPKSAYIGVNDVAHKIKKGYVGVDGVARKIKKAYIGIGGVARPCWSGGALTYYGKISGGMEFTRSDYAGTHVGNYALFGGGLQTDWWSTGDCVSDVHIIDSTLTYSTSQTGLSIARRGLSATHVGDYALFAGGNIDSELGSNSYMSNVVDAFSSKLIRTNPSSPLSHARVNMASTHIGDYALFGGGYNYNSFINTIDVYNTSLTKQANKTLSRAKSDLASTHVGNYAIFAGGRYNSTGSVYQASACNMVDVYDNSLTHSTQSSLSTGRYILSATHIDNYAIFAGGYDSFYTNAVDVYSDGMTKINTVQNLTLATELPSAASVGGSFALFYLGNKHNDSTGSDQHMIDVYDVSLTKTVLYDVNMGNVNTHVGDYTISHYDSSSACVFTVI